ncbi:MAG TPA: ATP-binding protein [Polyangiaceae bacterium]|nr:ATP-binding protein [Polyangiaceae bacterium]
MLIVEDEDDSAELVGEVLSIAGYQTERVTDGRAAIERLMQDPLPSLILLDLHMPVMNGWEFRLRQQASPRCADVPVIVVSGDSTQDPSALKVDYFLRKPFTVEMLEDTVRNAYAALEREWARAERLAHLDRLASLGTMAATMGHEINNPLTYIMSGVQFIERQLQSMASGQPDTRVTAMLENVAELRVGAERVTNIVRSLRVVSRNDGGATVKLSIRELLSTSATIARGEIRPRARLVEAFGEAPVIEGDEVKLSQVFVNLLVNAAQAIGDRATDQNEICVRTSTDELGDAVVEVQDTGSGIPDELRARVFDPFFTTKPVGTGTGLGLFISRGIVEAHGGTLTFESEVGRGTTFRVSLPPAERSPKALGSKD